MSATGHHSTYQHPVIAAYRIDKGQRDLYQSHSKHVRMGMSEFLRGALAARAWETIEYGPCPATTSVTVTMPTGRTRTETIRCARHHGHDGNHVSAPATGQMTAWVQK